MIPSWIRHGLPHALGLAVVSLVIALIGAETDNQAVLAGGAFWLGAMVSFLIMTDMDREDAP